MVSPKGVMQGCIFSKKIKSSGITRNFTLNLDGEAIVSNHLGPGTTLYDIHIQRKKNMGVHGKSKKSKVSVFP